MLARRDAQPARGARSCALGARWSRGVELAPRLGSEFLPELNEGSLYVTFTLPATISLDRGPQAHAEDQRRCCASDVPEVTEVLSQLGRPEDGTDAKLPNNLEIFVKLQADDASGAPASTRSTTSSRS